MLCRLEHDSPIPLHYQLTEVLRSSILNGTLVDDDEKMPSESQLSEHFNVSRITVRNAVKTLVDEGLVWRGRGKGTFIKNNKSENWVGKLMGFSEILVSAGFKPGGKVLYKGFVEKAPKKVFQQLKTRKLWELKRLRYADDHPIAIEHSYFLESIGEQLEQTNDLDHLLIYNFLENNLKTKINNAKQLISAINADKEDAKLLEIKEGNALLSIERVTSSYDGKNIEFLNAVYRPDFYHYYVDLNRP